MNSNLQSRTQEYSLLPRLESNIPHLTRSDVDLHMPYELNFNYYTSETFNNDNDIIECLMAKNSFSALNCNIRSLSANNDNLVNLLSELAFAFSLIGLTETKIKLNQDPIVNTKLSGYNFLSQPTYSNAGGGLISESSTLDIRDLKF